MAADQKYEASFCQTFSPHLLILHVWTDLLLLEVLIEQVSFPTSRYLFPLDSPAHRMAVRRTRPGQALRRSTGTQLTQPNQQTAVTLICQCVGLYYAWEAMG